jgi:uncharacterized protein (TIGR02001 family)
MTTQQLTRISLGLFSKVLLGTLAVGSHLSAQAEGPEPEYAIAYNVGVLSDYRVRGIAQTSTDPALQGGVDLTLKSGLYAGLFASNVKWVKELNGATKGSLEVDLYGGYRDALEVVPVSYDVGVINYRYPSNNSGVGGVLPAGTFDNANTVEVYGSATFQIYTFKYSRTVTNWVGNVNSKGSQYFDLSAAIDLGNAFTLVPHIGRQLITHQAGDLGDYTDLALTLSKDFGNGLIVTAAGLNTNANKTFYTDTKGRYLGKRTLVLGLKYNF